MRVLMAWRCRSGNGVSERTLEGRVPQVIGSSVPGPRLFLSSDQGEMSLMADDAATMAIPSRPAE
jgi:hypothetical protein